MKQRADYVVQGQEFTAYEDGQPVTVKAASNVLSCGSLLVVLDRPARHDGRRWTARFNNVAQRWEVK